MDKNQGHTYIQANRTRYHPGQSTGHYESFFQRANHPTRPLAFWIRYTIFSPRNAPEAALGELWAIYFNGETNQHIVAKQEFPFQQCTFDTRHFYVDIVGARLEPGRLKGSATSNNHTISWDLSFSGGDDPLFILPLKLYETKLPSAKSLVGVPMAIYNGAISADNQQIDVRDWVGSQNHNWGSKHTDQYAWGQVAGFDTHPDSFLEVATARLKLGPLWTPFMTPMVLRHQGREIALTHLHQTIRARGRFEYFSWSFRSETDTACIEGRIAAPKEAFVGLTYANPPGGKKYCLNSKIASCELKLSDPHGDRSARPEVLSTKHRAAFEILTDDSDHGVDIRV
jgi:hypothetical protein